MNRNILSQKKGEICFSQKVEVATRTVTTSSGLTAQRREQRRLYLLYQLQQLGMDDRVCFKILAFFRKQIAPLLLSCLDRPEMFFFHLQQ